MQESMILLASVNLLGTLAIGVLLVAILRKAGFGWGIALLGLLPMLGQVLERVLLIGGVLSLTEATLIVVPLTLLPHLLLAFRVWPRLAGLTTRSETFQ